MAKPNQVRPMLAAKFEEERVKKHLLEDKFLLMQPKIDGMRVLCDDGIARSRSWKPWTNRYLQAWCADNKYGAHGWDGEMLPGHFDFENPDPEIFRQAMSGLRSEDGSRQLTYIVFDNFDESWTKYDYQDRQKAVYEEVRGVIPDITDRYDMRVYTCPTIPVFSLEEIYERHSENLLKGWEGSILRRWRGGYKYNRATPSDGLLTKIKPMETAEALIIGYEVAYENQNTATTSLLGYTSRTAHKDNLVPKDYVGAFLCRSLGEIPQEFRIGGMRGFSHADRRVLLRRLERNELQGKYYVEYEHQGYGGGYDKPRCPIAIKIRPLEEM